jgi:hypothetical protein
MRRNLNVRFRSVSDQTANAVSGRQFARNSHDGEWGTVNYPGLPEIRGSSACNMLAHDNRSPSSLDRRRMLSCPALTVLSTY